MTLKPVFNPFTGTFDFVDKSESVVTVSAICKATDLVGDCVKIDDVKAGLLYQVEKVDIDLVGEKPAIGMIVAKSTATECTVQLTGIVTGIHSRLSAGQMYVVNVDGQITDTLAAPSSGFRYFQVMGVATSDDEFLLNPSFPRTKLRA